MHGDQVGSQECMKQENDNMKRVLFKGSASPQLLTVTILRKLLLRLLMFFKRGQKFRFLSKISRYLDMCNGFKKFSTMKPYDAELSPRPVSLQRRIAMQCQFLNAASLVCMLPTTMLSMCTECTHVHTHTALVMLSFLILWHLVKVYMKAFISIKMSVQVLVFTTMQLKNRN